MARPAASYICGECGAAHAKWAGRCDACGAWNALVEEAARGAGPGPGGAVRGRVLPLVELSGQEAPPPRAATGMAEVDRVLGGGLVQGSAVLVGGDPGIGKSTLLLQVAARLAGAPGGTIYVSGEEASAQVRLRAVRLGLERAPVKLLAETALADILATLEGARPGLAIVDSIQTMWTDRVDSAPGSVAQVRACAHELVNFAKRSGTAVVLVGHVTKDGQIAGPRVVEHLVDCVLYFEGERGHQFRILRSVKNRFGPAGEIGVFEMTGTGLAEVANPSGLFLASHGRGVPGTAVFAGIEGTRPLLVEIEALVAPAPPGSARRSVVGWDAGRLAMILAVLESRCAISFQGLDVYLSVAGGLRIAEPAADLAVAAALVSAREGVALPEGLVLFGEVGLSGALRPVAHVENRLKEAGKLGFTRAVLPAPQKPGQGTGLQTTTMDTLAAFVGEMFGAG